MVFNENELVRERVVCVCVCLREGCVCFCVFMSHNATHGFVYGNQLICLQPGFPAVHFRSNEALVPSRQPSLYV